MIFAGRGVKTADLADLPVLELRGLADDDARALVDSTVAGRLDPAVRDRLVAEARGHPGALLAPLRAAPETLAGGFGLPDAAGVPASTAEHWQQRLAQLPIDTQRLVLLGAAEPTGDAVLFWRAAARLDIRPDAAAPATAAGIFEVGQRVLFGRPGDRSSVYRGASPADRRCVHAALAGATDARVDPDRRVWHLANATAGLDEDVAAELERAAEHARTRAGLAAAAAFLDRAAALSSDPARRARRALAAARAKHLAGAGAEAVRLLAVACAGPLDASERAGAEVLRARIDVLSADSRGRSPGPALDVLVAHGAHGDALVAVLSRRGADAARLAAAIRAQRGGGPRDPLVEGLARLVAGEHAGAAAVLRQAIATVRANLQDEDALVRLWLAGRAARALGDVAAWDDLTRTHVELARTSGALSGLPIALDERVELELLRGDAGTAAELTAEAMAAIDAIGGSADIRAPSLLAAWNGDEARWIVGDLADECVPSPWLALELADAAARAGTPHRAADLLARQSALARASGSDWALAAEAASRALLGPAGAAEALHGEAIERAELAGLPFFVARTRLLYGEWLRREQRRREARTQLRDAHELLGAMGACGLAERACRELLATGATVRRRSACTRDDLTPQETRIARLAAAGHTNPEIGARLFLSPRTVEWHLRKVYPKLGVSRRAELRQALLQTSGV
jgi:DNA-binding CsgD family transcriptional regulator